MVEELKSGDTQHRTGKHGQEFLGLFRFQPVFRVTSEEEFDCGEFGVGGELKGAGRGHVGGSGAVAY
jgi:hypothetical protein